MTSALEIQITTYLDWLEHERRSPASTRETYARALRALHAFCDEKKLPLDAERRRVRFSSPGRLRFDQTRFSSRT